jgi:hypothetical protein
MIWSRTIIARNNYLLSAESQGPVSQFQQQFCRFNQASVQALEFPQFDGFGKRANLRAGITDGTCARMSRGSSNWHVRCDTSLQMIARTRR